MAVVHDGAMPTPAPSTPLRIAVLDDYLDVARDLAPWATLEADLTVLHEPIRDPEALVRTLEPFEVVCAMRERTALPAAVIERLPKLRLIVTSGMQNAAIDVEAARAAGIVVSGTGSTAAATAEMTWALIFAAARHVAEHDRSMRAGGWQLRLGVALAGRRLGVIGLGKNGGEVARIGLALGMDVVAWSRNLTAERAAEVGVRLVSFEELLESSDVITIHLRLSQRTERLIGVAELARMRPTAILVNTSRGPMVHEEALIEALERGTIGGAALDVYDDEPLPEAHPLRSLDRVVLSPHTGYVTDENMRRFYTETVEDIAAFVAGAPIRVL
jgi:phosphoglycerate dehydrogenase-like enzyme